MKPVVLPEEGSSLFPKRGVLCGVFLRECRKVLVNAVDIAHVQYNRCQKSIR